MSTTQAEFSAKIQRGIFNPVHRHLSAIAADNDRFEEGVAQTWRFYADRKARGIEPEDAILVTHCRRRATDMRRTLVGADGRHRKCVLDPRQYQKGRVDLCVFDEIGHAVIGSTSPEGDVVSALDLQSWLLNLTERDRAIVAGRAAGQTLKEIAKAVKMSFSGVNGRLKKLGAELAMRMGLPVSQVA